MKKNVYIISLGYLTLTSVILSCFGYFYLHLCHNGGNNEAVAVVTEAPEAQMPEVAKTEQAADQAAYDAALAAATDAVDKAASVGGEWRDTRSKKSTFV